MAAEVIPNNATTTLSANITTGGQASITVASAATFPIAGQYRILIDNEYMLVVSGQGTNTWGVTRGIEGTTATTHTAPAAITGILTNGGLTNFGPSGSFVTLTPGGLTGAVAATRYVGGTASGAPTTGAFLVGDFVIDQSGNVWICNVSGSPGTWNGVKPAPPALQPVLAARVDNSQATNITSYGDLTGTFGPQVTITTGTTALVTLSAAMGNSGQFNYNYMSVAVSGASTVAPSDSNAIQYKEPDTNPGTEGLTVSGQIYLTGLSAGSNVFTAKYRAAASNANFSLRTLSVMAL